MRAALKQSLDECRFRRVGIAVAAVYSRFDVQRFLGVALVGLDELTLMQRLRRLTEALHASLPSNYQRALDILRELAPHMGRGFAALALPDYVGQYGREDFNRSMDALAYF